MIFVCECVIAPLHPIDDVVVGTKKDKSVWSMENYISYQDDVQEAEFTDHKTFSTIVLIRKLPMAA